ncbi:FAD-dependent oxireductase [Formosa agariphila KMM 3901]|uniref:FAD-dependent oxireductase n=1 Tax=Formosa agariphila (strain DSM 15362 / KCTC 12365 / LMG 23005 / KMM 3901 / M-2Alg 35-1) TaxID=1347342 RepID=T2KJI5_FORAG|nr:FAD-dependent oxidoreductase [Formosa agariphila]CDF79052.1 FAD-dependent oxireductase [Formosa agariphila KMM 3901]
MSEIYSVGIIGGGVSGVVSALQLAEHNIDSILFEQENSVVNGPPFCHLHAGGNLYPDISYEQCKLLMKQSIEMARLFPQSIDERPTFISIPKTEKYEVDKIEQRLNLLVDYYQTLIDEDPENAILGDPKDYYKTYNNDDLQFLATQPTVKHPKTADEWMTNAIKLIDYTKLKTPIILVQEYGWNLFRLGAQAQLALNKTEYCNLKTNTDVLSITDVRDQNLGYNWKIQTKDNTYKVNYLVNSCGFKTGKFDESLHLTTERLIEFKAAYVSKWQPIPGLIPELIFHGERGTPHGMVQLTPYCDDYYQIHGMTNDITLFENGLVQSKDNKSQPEFNEGITKKLNHGWDNDDIKTRTENAIDSVVKFVPSFESASVGGPPLFGAQQIPGDDPNLRVGEVSFPCKSYARSEIVKASSALTVANQIINRMLEESVVSKIDTSLQQKTLLDAVSKNDIDELARELAVQRGYPEALSRLVIEKY